MGLKGSLSQSPSSSPPCCSMAFPALSPPHLTRLGPPSFCFSSPPPFYSPQLQHLVLSAIPVCVPQVSPGVGVP